MTPHPDVDASLAEVLAGVHGAMGGELVGMYVGGSLVREHGIVVAGPEPKALIERALAWRHGQPFDELPKVLTLLRETIERTTRS